MSSIIKPVAVDNKTMFLHQLPLLAVGGTVGFAGIVHTPQRLEQSLKVEQAVVVQPGATGCPLETSLCNETVSHLNGWTDTCLYNNFPQLFFLPNHEIKVKQNVFPFF